MISFLNINPQLAYILGVILCSGLFWIAGRFIMQGCRFRLARYVLLGSAFVSLLLPFVKIGILEPEVVENTVLPVGDFDYVELGDVVADPFWTLERFFFVAYALVSLALFLRFIVGILRLRVIERHSVVVSEGGIKVVTNSSIKSPFSFGRTIFVGDGDDHTSRAMILRHEEEHIRLHHSVDKTLMEFLSSIFWINPFFFLIKSSLTEVHEFEADSAVVNDGFNIADYKQLIFSQIGCDNPEVASGLVFSLTKKRIIMLSQTKKRGWVSVLTLIPAVALSLALVSFTERSDKLEIKDPKVAKTSSDPSITMTDINVAKIVLDEKGDKPLIFLDGKEIKSDQLNNIPENSFGSMEVFKGESAIALYGDRAKNGVLVITTKKDGESSKKGSFSVFNGDKHIKISEDGLSLRSGDYTVSVGGNFDEFEKSLKPQKGSEPLYLVNGYEVSSSVAKTIDAQTIASMDVIKSDKAVDLYGDRAKNGAVVITTKTAQKDSNKVVKTHSASFDQPVVSAETPALFDNKPGQAEFALWCQKNIKYPQEAKDEGIKGRVTVSFVVEPDGKLTNIKMVRSVDKLLDEATLDVVRRSPNLWTPAKNGDKPVRLLVNMPMIFKL